MEFYLVRHGEPFSEAINGERPLTPAGRRDVERLAQAAGERAASVSEILHSGILRARQTAEILAEVLNPIKGTRQLAGLKPDDDPFVARAELETATMPLMLVGHLPHMSRLAGCLLSGDPERAVVDFAPATMVCFSYDEHIWKMHWKLTPASL